MSPRKILAVKLRAMGDTLLMTAPLMELRRAYPEAEIHAAVTRPWDRLLEGHPAIHKVWGYDRYQEKTARARAVARLALQLRKERFDCVLNFHASPSSAALSFATGARIRAIHFHGHKDRNRYSTLEIPGKGTLKPIIERDMDTVRALGVHAPAGRLPQVFPFTQEIEAAETWLKKAALGSPLLVLGVGASRPTKSWPIERFAALAIEWCKARPKASALMIAGPGEEALLHLFLKNLDELLAAELSDPSIRTDIRQRVVSQIGLPLRQLAAILSRAAVFCGNDSGPKHLAVAVGTPTVTLFGPEDPYEWHPYPEETNRILTIRNLPCRKDALPGFPPWCALDRCTQERHRCMRDLGVLSALEACRQVERGSSR